MPNNGKKRGTGASTSFRRAEVDAICQLFEILNRGGDPKMVLRSEGITTVQQKFARMRIKLRKEYPQPVDELGSEEE